LRSSIKVFEEFRETFFTNPQESGFARCLKAPPRRGEPQDGRNKKVSLALGEPPEASE